MSTEVLKKVEIVLAELKRVNSKIENESIIAQQRHDRAELQHTQNIQAVNNEMVQMRTKIEQHFDVRADQLRKEVTGDVFNLHRPSYVAIIDDMGTLKNDLKELRNRTFLLV